MPYSTLHSNDARLCIPVRGPGLGQSPSIILAAVRYFAPRLLYGSDELTSLEFTGLRADNGIQISMDGKGCWRDNVFVERFWRSVKYEEVYRYAYEGVSEAKKGLERYVMRYNQRRPHTARDGNTPDECYLENVPTLPKTA